MSNERPPTDHGLLNIYCLECSEMISWRKEHVIRDDGYYNWRIVASCRCGEAQDPEIKTMARAAYDAASIDDLFNVQETAMEKVIGPDLQNALNLLSSSERSSNEVLLKRSTPTEFPHA